jgi:GNAT superfamily N-acetyltransferase
LGRFIYLDQIGVEKAFQGQGVAPYLIQEFEKTVRSELILATVFREPIYNARSHHFLIKEGYLAVADFYTEELNGLSGVRSTVFIKEKPKL